MNIQDQLRRDEGVRAFPYSDTRGFITIGVGHNLSANGLTGDVINLILANDIDQITAQLHDRLPWFQSIDPVRQAVLVNMGFNLGFTGLEEFPRMLMAFAQGDWNMASAEMMNSEWARQVGDRSVRLAQQVKTGQWA